MIYGLTPTLSRTRFDAEKFNVHIHAKSKTKKLIIPEDNKEETNLIEGIEIYPIKKLLDLISINTQKPYKEKPIYAIKPSTKNNNYKDVKGQFIGKRAMEIVATGHHNILLIGPPGSGKSMLLQRLPSIMPKLTKSEQIEILKIQSISKQIHSQELSTERPFQTPRLPRTAKLHFCQIGRAHV